MSHSSVMPLHLAAQPAVARLRQFFFFFNDPATTELYTLPLHDALPILPVFPCIETAGGIYWSCGALGPTDDALPFDESPPSILSVLPCDPLSDVRGK